MFAFREFEIAFKAEAETISCWSKNELTTFKLIGIK